MKKKISSILRLISVEVAVIAVLFTASLFVFSYIAGEIVLENDHAFDTGVADYISAHVTPQLVQTMQVITFFGSTQFLLPAYILLTTFFLVKKNSVAALDIAIIAVSSSAILFLLKHLFKRPRPHLPIDRIIAGYSFPSGHTLSAFIFCSILAYLAWQSRMKRGWKFAAIFFLFLFSLGIGLSRLILHAHYATDVIAGFCLGLVWGFLSFGVIRKIRSSIFAKKNDGPAGSMDAP